MGCFYCFIFTLSRFKIRRLHLHFSLSIYKCIYNTLICCIWFCWQNNTISLCNLSYHINISGISCFSNLFSIIYFGKIFSMVKHSSSSSFFEIFTKFIKISIIRKRIKTINITNFKKLRICYNCNGPNLFKIRSSILPTFFTFLLSCSFSIF